jgi:NADH dehydrogenase FAD-containing subunit
VVIGGAGVVAVELAANVAEELAKKGPLKPGLVTLLAGSKLLPTYPPRVQAKAAAVLQQLGVAVVLDRAAGGREAGR